MKAPFAHWELAARTAMADRGIGYAAAEPLVAEVKAHCAQSGESPWDAFGSPEDFAEAAAAEWPASVRARRDLRGNTPGEYVSGAAFVLAVMTVPTSLLAAALNGSLSLHLTVAGLVGSLVFVLCWLTFFAAPGALRAAGHPRLAPWGYALATMLVVVAALAFTELPQTKLATVPLLLITAIAVLTAWLLTRPDRTDPFLVSPTATAEDDDLALDPDNDQQWFERLHGLLVGRFDIPKERAAQFVDEARSHLSATRTSPREEFGPVAAYAMNLAAGEQQRQVPWWRTPSAELAVRAVLTVTVPLLSVQYWNGGHEGIAVVGGLLTLGVAWGALKEAQRHLQARRTTSDSVPPA